jgi:hypothetical protein
LFGIEPPLNYDGLENRDWMARERLMMASTGKL